MVEPSASITLASAIHFSSPGRPIPTPHSVHVEIAVIWVSAFLLVSFGVTAVIAFAASAGIRRRWYAFVLLAVGVVALGLGTRIMLVMA